MKIAIFGGTGPTGQHLVEQALQQGHEVTVLVRTPSKLKVQHDRLTVVQGDARDAAKVAETVAGTEASALLLLMARELFEDSERACRAIRAGHLDWTLARAPRLTDEPAKGTIQVGYAGVGTGMRMARPDVATFMLRQLTSGEWAGKAPMISN